MLFLFATNYVFIPSLPVTSIRRKTDSRLVIHGFLHLKQIQPRHLVTL